uniref:Putative mitochondrial import protein pam17 n=2 Tax=Haematobia irritans TaxID=7368 RepID=A0A1L8E8I2_HAEIR
MNFKLAILYGALFAIVSCQPTSNMINANNESLNEETKTQFRMITEGEYVKPEEELQSKPSTTVVITNPASNPEDTPSISFTSSIHTSSKYIFGLQCMMGIVKNIADAASDFQYEIEKCGIEIPLDMENVLEDSEDLNRISKKIIDSNNKVCGNGDYKDEDGKNTTNSRCAKIVERQMHQLRRTISEAQKDISSLDLNSSCHAFAVTNFEMNLRHIDRLTLTCAEITTNNFINY